MANKIIGKISHGLQGELIIPGDKSVCGPGGYSGAYYQFSSFRRLSVYSGSDAGLGGSGGFSGAYRADCQG